MGGEKLQAPEVEALRQAFAFVQPVELIDGFAVSHMPVQVTVPVNGDAHYTTLWGTQTLEMRARQDPEIPILVLVSLFPKEGTYLLEKRPQKVAQG